MGIGYFGEKYGYTPPQEQMHGNLFEVLPDLLKINQRGAATETIKDFPIPELERQRDIREVSSKETRVDKEKSDLAVFLEEGMLHAHQYNWFDSNIDNPVEAVYFKKGSDVDNYNDHVVGTDFMLELPPTEAGQKSAVLRVDATKTSDLDRLADKADTKREMELQSGKFGAVYFKTSSPETSGRPALEKIDTAPRVVLHLDTGQITELGQLLYQDKIKKRPGAFKDIQESSLQLNLIDQAKHQLENQAIEALAMFVEAVGRWGSTHRLPPQQIEAVQNLYQNLVAAVDAKDSSQAQALVAEFKNSKHLLNLPRSEKTQYLLDGISPWIDHFVELDKKKKGSLPQTAIEKAQRESALSRSHQALVNFPSEDRNHLPGALVLK